MIKQLKLLYNLPMVFKMQNIDLSPWPSFTNEEQLAVLNVLKTNKVNYWTGNECRHFEKEFAAWTNSQYAISVCNGTLALQLALHAIGVGPGDEVIVTPRTFIASVSCITIAGATPVFADVDSNSGNISPHSICEVITPRTKAVIAVHLAGYPCDMDALMEISRRYNISVIEDCAQAHGARYKGRSVGSIGQIGAWSFCQDKIMTTGGEGGMITTNDEALWRRMWSYKDHGKSYEAVYASHHPPGFRWLHESFGTNYRMLEIQAAIGRLQLKNMHNWTNARNANAHEILKVCSKYASVRVPIFDDDNGLSVHAYYKCYVYIKGKYLKSGWSRDRIIEEINLQHVPCFHGSCSEVYLEKAFQGTGWAPEKRLTVARDLGESSIMFLVHPTLNTYDIEKTCQAIDKVLNMSCI
jgi:dTDP-4-amino-4,6-dideoxygalactose transaminase